MTGASRRRPAQWQVLLATLLATAAAVALPASPSRADVFDDLCDPPIGNVVTPASPTTAVTLASGDTLLLDGIDFTGGINAFPAGATICVSDGATLLPAYFGDSPAGTLVVDGGATATIQNTSLNTGFRLENVGTTLIPGGIGINGAVVLNNSEGATIDIDTSISLLSATVLSNEGLVTVAGDFTTSTPSTVDNRGEILVTGSVNLGGVVDNFGVIESQNIININDQSQLTNSCVLLADDGLNNNGTSTRTVNEGLIWVAPDASNFPSFQNNTIFVQTSTGAVEGPSFVNNSSVTGAGTFVFAGQTTNQGSQFAGTDPSDPIVFFDETQTTGGIFDTSFSPTPNVVREPVDRLGPGYRPQGCDARLLPQADLAVTKDGPATVGSGGTVDYQVTVANLGPGLGTDIVVVDDLPPELSDVTASDGGVVSGGQVTWTVADLAVGASTVFTVSGTAPASGALTNVVSVSSGSTDPVADNDQDAVTTEVTVTESPAVAVDKAAGDVTDLDGNGDDAGDTVVYTFTVTNPGDVALSDVELLDAACDDEPLLTGGDDGDGVLVTTETWTFTCTHTILQAEVDAGAIVNVVQVTAVAPSGTTVTAQDTTTTVLAGVASLAVDKVATLVDGDGDGLADVGEAVAYTFTVTNDGTLTVESVAIDDGELLQYGISIGCTPMALAPGEQATCSADADRTVQQADVDAGSVDNAATATGTGPDGSDVTSPPDQASVDADSRPALSLDKQLAGVADLNGDGLTNAGDELSYEMVVTNAGTTTLTGVVVTDPLLGGVVCTQDLAVGEVVTCAPAPYVVSDQDVAARAVVNTATATSDQTEPTDDTETVPVTSSPALDIDKRVVVVTDVNGDGLVNAGDEITYEIEVGNGGDIPLTGVEVTDPLLGGQVCAVDLALAESVTCGPVTYTVTAADVASGVVVNTATADSDQTEPTEDSETVQTGASAAVGLDKQITSIDDVNGDGLTNVGDVITYTFVVTNGGDVALSAITVSDPLVGGDVCTVDLELGASATCGPVDYTVQPADVEAGAVVNTATADGDQVEPSTDSETVVATSSPAIGLDKQVASVVDVNDDGVTNAGDQITYTFVVTNGGDVPLTGVTVTDPLVGGEVCTTDLALGASETCGPVVYTVTADDVLAGEVVNTATAESDRAAQVQDTERVAVVASPALALDKQVVEVVDVTGDGRVAAGDEVTYAFEVTNTGDVPLTGIVVDDPLTAGVGLTVSCDPVDLAVGESVVCTTDGPYVVTQDEVDAGQVVNVATAAATGPSGEAVLAPADQATVVLDQVSLLTISKDALLADEDGDGAADVGETVTYGFTVVNAGTVRVGSIVVDDPLLAGVGIDISCGAGLLEPGGSVLCAAAADYVVTQEDVDAGAVVNAATASGLDPGDDPVISEPAMATIGTDQTAALVLDKQATLLDDDGVDTGEVIVYGFTVWNTGTVTLVEPQVTDPMLGGAVACPEVVLAPGDSVACGPVSWEVVAAAGQTEVVNTAVATARAVSCDCDDPTDTASAVTPIEPSEPSEPSETVPPTPPIGPTPPPDVPLPPVGSGEPDSSSDPAGSLATTGVGLGFLVLAAGMLLAAGVVVRRGARRAGSTRRG